MPLTNDITRGLLNRKRPLVISWVKIRWNNITKNNQQLMNKQVLNYAKGISTATELPLETVLKSEPVKTYRDRIWFGEKKFK